GLDDLERARESQARDLVGRQSGDVVALEAYTALLGTVIAGDHVEQRRLAGPVGSDDAEQVAGADHEAHRAHRGEPTEALGDRLKREHGSSARADGLRFPSAPPARSER